MRLRCCVPFCNATVKAKPGDSEVICVEHWKATSSVWRRRYAKIRKAGYPGPTAHMWQKLKEQAIERAAGIQ